MFVKYDFKKYPTAWKLLKLFEKETGFVKFLSGFAFVIFNYILTFRVFPIVISIGITSLIINFVLPEIPDYHADEIIRPKFSLTSISSPTPLPPRAEEKQETINKSKPNYTSSSQDDIGEDGDEPTKPKTEKRPILPSIPQNSLEPSLSSPTQHIPSKSIPQEGRHRGLGLSTSSTDQTDMSPPDQLGQQLNYQRSNRGLSTALHDSGIGLGLHPYDIIVDAGSKSKASVSDTSKSRLEIPLSDFEQLLSKDLWQQLSFIIRYIQSFDDEEKKFDNDYKISIKGKKIFLFCDKQNIEFYFNEQTSQIELELAPNKSLSNQFLTKDNLQKFLGNLIYCLYYGLELDQ